jgi:hypothetical protein
MRGVDGLLDYWIIGLLDCWIVGLLDCWIAGWGDCWMGGFGGTNSDDRVSLHLSFAAANILRLFTLCQYR